MSNTHPNGLQIKEKHGQDKVYLHMSHHYRRLYNAKSIVDTGRPKHFKPHNSNTDPKHGLLSAGERSRNMKGAIREDTLRYFPKPAFCHHKCFGSESVEATFCPNLPDVGRAQMNPLLHLSIQNLTKSSINLRRTKEEMDIMNRHMDKFVYPGKAFNPRILKSDTASKLLQLRVYKSPRRRLKNALQKPENMKFQHMAKEEVSEWLQNEMAESIAHTSSEVTLPSSFISGAMEETQRSSKTSSCDSAYNESCRESSEQEPVVETNASEIDANTILTPEIFSIKDKEDLYVKFMHNLTEDVLKNNIYSNQGLKQLFSRHMEQYRNLLDWCTMSKKVEELILYWEVTDNPTEWMNSLIHQQRFYGEGLEEPLVNKLTENRDKEIGSTTRATKAVVKELLGVNSPKVRQAQNKIQESDQVIQELLRELSIDCTITKQM